MSTIRGLLGLLGVGLATGLAAAQMPPATPMTVSALPDPAKPAATVNGTVIPFAELEPLLKQIGPLPVALPEARRREMQRDALALLIDDLLMQQFLDKHAPKPDPQEVAKRMAELEEGQKAKGKTVADLLKETYQTEQQLRRSVHRLVQWSAYSRDKVKDADLEKYFNDYKPFFDRTLVRASHIALRVSPTATPAEKEALAKKLKDLRAEIVAGKLDFAEAAKKHSHCPTAPEGGDVGLFPRKFVVDEAFARTAFGMKVGDLSDVVESEFGLHLIKVTERKEGKPAEFAKCKDDVREFYVEDLHQTILAEQRKKASIEIHLP